MGIDAELVADVRNHVGEGPAWDERDGSILWIDIVPGSIFKLTPATGELTRISIGREVSVVIPRASGGYVIAVQDGIFTIDRIEQGVPLVPLVEIEIDNPGNLMNDCKCDAVGRLWGGTRARDWTPEAGALYRIDPDLSVEKVLEGISISNGLGWSPDGTQMYYVDSKPGTLDVLDYDLATGKATNRRRFADIAPEVGSADGLCVDDEGCVWLAVLRDSALYRYAPDGTLAEKVTVPTHMPTSVCFGGPDYTDLYMTSASVDMTAEDFERDPRAGGVFVLRPGVSGARTVPFAG